MPSCATFCNKYEWVDLYPKGHEERAKIDDFLHYHHRNIKEASLAYFAPMARPDLGLTDDVINMAKRLFKNGLNALETQWLKKNNYICGDKATIADIAAYVEVGQLQSQFTNLFNFEPFPNINRWLERMTQMKGHDDVHLVLSELGNINITPPVMEDLMEQTSKASNIFPIKSMALAYKNYFTLINLVLISKIINYRYVL